MKCMQRLALKGILISLLISLLILPHLFCTKVPVYCDFLHRYFCHKACLEARDPRGTFRLMPTNLQSVYIFNFVDLVQLQGGVKEITSRRTFLANFMLGKISSENEWPFRANISDTVLRMVVQQHLTSIMNPHTIDKSIGMPAVHIVILLQFCLPSEPQHNAG